MENLLFPICLEEYCSYFGVLLEDLELPCIFCRLLISPEQLSVFQARNLSLVWREGNCYAACLQCISDVARYERDKYFQCTVNGIYIEYFTQKPLQELVVRCLYCMALLTNEEKVDTIGCGCNFYLVRTHWKGVCRSCIENAGTATDN
uniref:Protein E6 n=1 Tax=Human papillomavirus TaxID=10566 RepID=A0A385PJJ0_9PAPI|nr:MAG: E6 protein [Human papillomavirus]